MITWRKIGMRLVRSSTSLLPQCQPACSGVARCGTDGREEPPPVAASRAVDLAFVGGRVPMNPRGYGENWPPKPRGAADSRGPLGGRPQITGPLTGPPKNQPPPLPFPPPRRPGTDDLLGHQETSLSDDWLDRPPEPAPLVSRILTRYLSSRESSLLLRPVLTLAPSTIGDDALFVFVFLRTVCAVCVPRVFKTLGGSPFCWRRICSIPGDVFVVNSSARSARTNCVDDQHCGNSRLYHCDS